MRHWHMGTRRAGAAVLEIHYSFFWQAVAAVTCSHLGLPVATCCYFGEEVAVAAATCCDSVHEAVTC